MSKLTCVQNVQITNFVKTTFDTRLRLAWENQQFLLHSTHNKRKRMSNWLQHYAKLALTITIPKPSFADNFKEVLEIFIETSKIYKVKMEELRNESEKKTAIPTRARAKPEPFNTITPEEEVAVFKLLEPNRHNTTPSHES